MSSDNGGNTGLSTFQSSARPLPPGGGGIAGKKPKTNWEARIQERQRMAAMKAREREMRQEKEDEKNRKIEVRRERQHKAEEKARLQFMAERVRTC